MSSTKFTCDTIQTDNLVIPPANGTVVANAVTVNGTAGIITYSSTFPGQGFATIIVTNSSATVNSIILLQVMDGLDVGGRIGIFTDVVSANGSFTIRIANDNPNGTVVPPRFAYLIINP